MSAPERGRTVEIKSPVMARNDGIAAANRRIFDENKTLVVNIISSPGSGKTALLAAMAGMLGGEMAVIAGDVQTRRDAERIAAAGCVAHQIETGGACHLDARGIAAALDAMNLPELGCRALIIENVGNLVCPASFDLGEHMKVALLSVPEGDDKVLKYPAIFSRISALVISKMDLLPHVDFDATRAERECATLNDAFDVFRLSAMTGEGVRAFCDFLLEKQSALAG